jgi:hypothetical protein
MPAIEFLCPNGHRIRCQAENAGRAAQCPRCRVKFRVPESAELDLPAASDSDPGYLGLDFTDSGIAAPGPAAPDSATPGEAEIEFLCPSGHHLHGPASLQGKPGECPECGARFRIPGHDEVSAEEKTGPAIDLDPASIGQDFDVGGVDLLGIEKTRPPQLGNGRAAVGERPTPATISPPVSDAGKTAPTIAGLFARLWNMRREGTSVELRLRDGATILPDQYFKELSQPSHALFAVKESDGSTSLVAVAWESVDRATLRGLSQLPSELADSTA